MSIVLSASVINAVTITRHNDKECVHCHNDKYVHKVYSFDNNMDPGPISPALMVMFMEFYPYSIYIYVAWYNNVCTELCLPRMLAFTSYNVMTGGEM